jgi:hypothetical protein
LVSASVDVIAYVALKTGVTITRVRIDLIVACAIALARIFRTVVNVVLAFVTIISCCTLARERAHLVKTCAMSIACLAQTLVDVCLTIGAFKTIHAFTGVAS